MIWGRNIVMALALLALVPRAALAGDDAPTFQALGQRGMAEYGSGRVREAVATAKLALAAAERATGKESQDTADQLWNLGRYQEAIGEFAEAERAFVRALPLYEKHAGKDHPYVAEVLMATARVRAALSRHEEARTAFLRMLVILEPLAAKDPAVELQLASYLATGAFIYELLNERAEAERLLLRGLAIYDNRFGEDDSRVIAMQELLAKLYFQSGKFAQALQLHQRVLDLKQKRVGADSPMLMGTVGNLAADLHALGRMAEAQRHFQRALELQAIVGSSANETSAALLANYCAFLRERGDLPSAIQYCKRAVAAFDSLQDEGYGLALAIGHLGTAYLDTGNVRDGVLAVERSLELRRKFWGAEHPMVGYVLITLAGVYDGTGQHDKARAYAQQALDLMTAAYGPDHPTTAEAIDMVAQLRAPEDRLELMERALAMRENGLGEDHPQVARTWYRIAMALLARGELGRSRDALARCSAIREKHLSLVLGVGNEIQKSQAIDMLADEMGATIALHLRHLPTDEAAARLAFDTILQRKGRAVDALVSDLGALRARAAPEDRGLLDDLAATRARLASLSLDEAGGAKPHNPGKDAASEVAQRRALVAELRSSVLTLEERVAERSATFRRASQRATFEQVRAAIPADAALVEIVAYWPEGWNPTARRQREHFRYAAYVLRSDGVIRGVDLGPEPDVNAVVVALRHALATRDGDPGPAARKLHGLVMAPLAGAIGDAKRVFLSADGMLTLVPFAALIDERGTALLERYVFTYLAGARELVREPAASEGVTGDVVLVGAPAFGSVGTAGGGRGGHPFGLAFLPLPGTRGEVEELASALVGAKTLLGDAASEGAIKSLRSPRILHIATHGFFVGAEASHAAGSVRGVQTVQLANGRDELGPLLRSGLAFAAANDGGRDDEDGVLTAMEAASLDLSGTELVVLSACETGVGATSQGDGVRGLRRSLSIAGARTQMMSLWKVDDDATRALMVGFYDQLAAGVGRAAALRNVQLAMSHDARTAHPYYWAGFIVSGSDAPLQLNKRAQPQPSKTPPGQRGCACEVVGEGRDSWTGLLLALLLGAGVVRRGAARMPPRLTPARSPGACR